MVWTTELFAEEPHSAHRQRGMSSNRVTASAWTLRTRICRLIMHDVSIFWSSVESSRPVGVAPSSSLRLMSIPIMVFLDELRK